MNLNDWVEKCHENAIAHGWWDGEKRTFGELIALCHSELSEALEDYRNGCKPNEMYFECTACDGERCDSRQDTHAHKMGVHYCLDAVEKPCGIPSELADVLIRIFDMCGYYGIDLDKAVNVKHDYNKTRPIKHGGKVI